MSNWSLNYLLFPIKQLSEHLDIWSRNVAASPSILCTSLRVSSFSVSIEIQKDILKSGKKVCQIYHLHLQRTTNKFLQVTNPFSMYLIPKP